ncbi:hypothetical protein H8959_012820, partial [Pygathrix nigripes]
MGVSAALTASFLTASAPSCSPESQPTGEQSTSQGSRSLKLGDLPTRVQQLGEGTASARPHAQGTVAGTGALARRARPGASGGWQLVAFLLMEGGKRQAEEADTTSRMLSQSDSQALPEKAGHWEKAAVDLLQPQDGDMGMTGQLPAALKLAQQLGWPLTQLPTVPSTRCPKSTCSASLSLPAPLCFSATARHRGVPGDGNCWQGAPAGPGLQTVCVWEWAGPETPLPLLKVPERRRASARLELEACRGLVLADRQEMESRWRQQFSPEPKGLMPGE